jgi:putative hydrolase of the HAD superfamily
VRKIPYAFDAVLFDLDDTLLDGGAAWTEGLARLLRRCPGLDPAAARKAWDVACEEHYPRYLSGELTFDEHRVARIRSWATLTGTDVPPGAELEWFAVYRAGYESAWTAFADVAPCLDALSQSVKLGLITNGDSVQQRDKLKALGLANTFDAVAASADIGIAKPDLRIFRHAVGQLGVAPERCVYVGDRHDSDARAAAAAGMTGVWLNRAGLPAPDGEVAEISSLVELPLLLTAKNSTRYPQRISAFLPRPLLPHRGRRRQALRQATLKAMAPVPKPGDSNGTIAAARQCTQLRQHVRHSDTKGAIAYTDALIASPGSATGRPHRGG